MSNELPEDIQAQNEWYKNVNGKLVVMIKNAADVLDTYVQNLEPILVALKETQTIYSRLHSDLIEALDEQPSTNSTRLRESHPRNVSERRGGSDNGDRSSNSIPFGISHNSSDSA